MKTLEPSFLFSLAAMMAVTCNAAPFPQEEITEYVDYEVEEEDYDNVQDQENLGEEILNVYLEKLSCFVGKFVNPECWKKKGKNTHVVFTSFFDDLLK